MHGDVCKSVYCHYDGYLDYTGRILLAHYDSTAANQLIARGDEFLDQVSGCCGEYYYVMRDGVWYAGCVYDTEGLVKHGLVPLSDALAAIAAADVA